MLTLSDVAHKKTYLILIFEGVRWAFWNGAPLGERTGIPTSRNVYIVKLESTTEKAQRHLRKARVIRERDRYIYK